MLKQITKIGSVVKDVNVHFFQGKDTGIHFLNVSFWCNSVNVIGFRSVVCAIEANKTAKWW